MVLVRVSNALRDCIDKHNQQGTKAEVQMIKQQPYLEYRQVSTAVAT